jgi:RimJ/RimL family protein N-acetyltransferase
MAGPGYPEMIPGEGLVLRPWEIGLVEQLARWSEHGFPYQAFDLAHLRDPARATATLARMREPNQHRNFIACQGGQAVGRVSVNLRDPAGLYIWGVHVPPDHEGRGVCRRMVAALLGWLEQEQPGRGFVLTSNAFAARAHAAYRSLGFEVSETRWHYDQHVAAHLWSVPPAVRRPVQPHLRFQSGRWEIRTYVFRRPSKGRACSQPAAAAARP